MHEPADVSRELLSFRTREQHAIVQCVQETLLGHPALLFDQNAMHDRDLTGGSTKASASHAQPSPECFAQCHAVAARFSTPRNSVDCERVAHAMLPAYEWANYGFPLSRHDTSGTWRRRIPARPQAARDRRDTSASTQAMLQAGPLLAAPNQVWPYQLRVRSSPSGRGDRISKQIHRSWCRTCRAARGGSRTHRRYRKALH